MTQYSSINDKFAQTSIDARFAATYGDPPPHTLPSLRPSYKRPVEPPQNLTPQTLQGGGVVYTVRRGGTSPVQKRTHS